MSNIVNLSKCAELFGMTRQTLSNLIKDEGMPVVESTGRKGKEVLVDTVAVFQWLDERVSGKTPYQADLIRKIRAQRHKIEMENKERAEQCLLTVDVATQVSMLVSTLKSTLKGRAKKIAGKNQKLQKAVLNEHRRILAGFYNDAADWLRNTTGTEIGPPAPLTDGPVRRKKRK